MNAFVDCFGSKHVQVHFDTGNVMLFQFPEHWIPILGRRIKNVHFKEFSKKGTDHTLESFRTLLDGTTNWPAVMDALEQAGYEGYLTFEYFHPFPHYPEALIEQSSDALDRILGRRVARVRLSCPCERIRIRPPHSRRPARDLAGAIGAVAEMGGGGGAHAGLGRGVGRLPAADALDPVGQMQQLAIGLVVEIRPLLGIAPQDP